MAKRPSPFRFRPSGSRRPDFPSAPLYVLATISLILPFAGAALMLWGGAILATDRETHGVLGTGLVVAGVLAIIIDFLLDVVWANPSLSLTDEPTLNRPAEGLIGRTALVTETIIDGRGKVCVNDAIWIAEGEDTPIGETVLITANRDVVLIVSRPGPASSFD